MLIVQVVAKAFDIFVKPCPPGHAHVLSRRNVVPLHGSCLVFSLVAVLLCCWRVVIPSTLLRNRFIALVGEPAPGTWPRRKA